jgi:hypothetical protein
MGYSFATFHWLHPFTPPGSRVLDLGSQDISIGCEAELVEVNKFIAHGGGIAQRIARYPATYTAAEIWTRAGYDYRCIDVDERPDTIRVDLQGCEYPTELKYAFDLVMNAGTTEHLANPAGGLAFAHYACRNGGVIAHDVPLFGLKNHGLVNPTPKFWSILRWLNNYEVLSAAARQCEELPGDPNHYSEALSFIAGVEAAVHLSWMISIAFRKRGSAAFVAPIDAVLPKSDGTLEAQLISSAMLPLIAGGVWSEAEADDAVRQATRAIKGRSIPIRIAAKVASAIAGRLRAR